MQHMVQQKQQEKHHQRTIQTKASLAKRVTTLFQTRRWADSVKSDGREILYSLGAVLLQCCVVVSGWLRWRREVRVVTNFICGSPAIGALHLVSKRIVTYIRCSQCCFRKSWMFRACFESALAVSQVNTSFLSGLGQRKGGRVNTIVETKGTSKVIPGRLASPTHCHSCGRRRMCFRARKKGQPTGKYRDRLKATGLRILVVDYEIFEWGSRKICRGPWRTLRSPVQLKHKRAHAPCAH